MARPACPFSFAGSLVVARRPELREAPLFPFRRMAAFADCRASGAEGHESLSEQAAAAGPPESGESGLSLALFLHSAESPSFFSVFRSFSSSLSLLLLSVEDPIVEDSRSPSPAVSVGPTLACPTLSALIGCVSLAIYGSCSILEATSMPPSSTIKLALQNRFQGHRSCQWIPAGLASSRASRILLCGPSPAAEAYGSVSSGYRITYSSSSRSSTDTRQRRSRDGPRKKESTTCSRFEDHVDMSNSFSWLGEKEPVPRSRSSSC